MRTLTILVAALAVSSFVAGCGDKKDDPSPTTTTPGGNATTTPPTGGTTTPTTPTPPPPAPDETITIPALKYGNPNSPAEAVTVGAGATSITVTFTVNQTAGGPYAINGPGTPPMGKPGVELLNNGTRQGNKDFDSTQGAGVTTGSGSKIYDAATFTASSPAPGEWKVGIYGTGTNAEVHATVVISYK